MVSKYNVKVQYAAWMSTVTLATVVVMTAIHMQRELNQQEKVIQHRGEIAAQILARSIVSGMLSNSFPAIAQAADLLSSDKDIILVRILDANDQEVFPKYNHAQPSSLVVATAPVISGSNAIGKVEVGMGQASMSMIVVHGVFLDLSVGVLMIIAAVGVSALASAPVRGALK